MTTPGVLHALEYGGFRYACHVRAHPSPARPVLFIGGAFQSMASWRRFADHFAPHRTVVLCDLPGSGDADILPSRFGLDFLAASVSHMIDRLRLHRVDVVSASYGSPVAYCFAQRFAGRVGRLVLAGVMPSIPPDRRGSTIATLDALTAGRTAEFVRLVLDGLLCTDRARHVERRAVVRRLLKAQLERMSSRDRLRYVHNTTRLLEHEPLDLSRGPDVPALVFTGEHDVYTTPSDCHTVASAFTEATFTTVPMADHLFHLEQFDATLGLLDRFLGPPDSRTTPDR
ncbi:MAG: alpha/beta hydrolase [Acidobacteria bacterium]|nr:alpha/beta hydrolase [Acidobacteriota bacterium]